MAPWHYWPLQQKTAHAPSLEKNLPSMHQRARRHTWPEVPRATKTSMPRMLLHKQGHAARNTVRRQARPPSTTNGLQLGKWAHVHGAMHRAVQFAWPCAPRPE
eukprot:3733170-Alexandrium_andersonii.AAC.1